MCVVRWAKSIILEHTSKNLLENYKKKYIIG